MRTEFGIHQRLESCVSLHICFVLHCNIEAFDKKLNNSRQTFYIYLLDQLSMTLETTKFLSDFTRKWKILAR